MIWVQLAMFVVSFFLTALLAPKPKLEDARAQGLDSIDFPQANEGTPIQLVLGKVRMRGPNTLWYGDFRTEKIRKKVKTGLFSSKRVTVGYKYYVGFDLALGLGPDAHLHTIWVDKKVLWSGDIGPSETSVAFDKENMFGGEKRGGGMKGTFTYYGGSFTQPRNSYLSAKVDPDIPGYGGLIHLVFEQVYIGTSAQLRQMSFELSRYPNGLGLPAGDHKIGDDLNPMECLYQILTSDWGGMDVDASVIDVASFKTAATALANEGNGMSLAVSSANSGKDVVEEVLRQIDGVLYQDPQTGNIVASLIRYDYDPLNLDEYGESDIVSVRNFSRTSWEETVNEARVTFTNRANKYEKGVSKVMDMANINAQGRRRPINVSFPGCTTAQLAVDLATRELTQLSVPIYKATLELNRGAAQLRPGDPFKMSWPDYGVVSIIMRVQRFNLGELLDGRVVVEAVQDKFATNLTVFAPPDNTLHTPIDTSAVDITSALATEAPYWLLQRQEFVVQPDPDGCYPLLLARQPNDVQQAYSATIDEFLVVDEVGFTNTAVLQAAIADSDGFASGSISSIVISQPSPGSDWLAAATATQVKEEGRNLFFLGQELMAFQTLVDNGDGTWTLGTVRRALLDTKPLAHSAGDTLFFVSIDGLSTGQFSDTAQFTAALQSHTSSDLTPLGSAPTVSHTPSQRYERPLPPDYVRFNSSRTPAEATSAGPHTIDWRPRSRLTGDLQFEDDAADTEEAGVTYTLRFYLNDVLQSSKTQSGLSSPTASFTFDSPTSGTGRFEVESVRSGFSSYTTAPLELSVNVS